MNFTPLNNCRHCEESATKQSRVLDCHVAKPPRNDRFIYTLPDRVKFLFVGFVLLTAYCLLLTAPVAHAHVTGASWEQVFNQYKVDVGYDPGTFIVGEPVRYDFNVTREQGGQDVDFADVWVRITQGNTTIFASGIHKPTIGRTGMTFTFPKAGDYELNVRFQKAGESIVDAKFPLTVAMPVIEPVRKPLSPVTVLAWAGWPVALIGIVILAFKKKK